MIYTLFEVIADETLHNLDSKALVLAKSKDSAEACMTYSSDSCWVSVANCKKIDDMDITLLIEKVFDSMLYKNAGAWIVKTFNR